MAYGNFLILGMRVLFGLVVIPSLAARAQWQGVRTTISTHQIATITRTPTPTESLTPSPSTDPTATATITATPTSSLTPTLNPTFTATENITPTPFPTSPLPPSPCPCPLYLPLVFAIHPAVIQEVEPNDTFSLAQGLPILPANVNGTHDGVTDTGDVYQFELFAGQIVHVTLTTENPSGVQLLAYSGEAPNEIVRDFESPFELNFLAIATGTYYLYVYTPGSTNNTAAYTLSVAWVEANP